jgi:hypothetical protein
MSRTIGGPVVVLALVLAEVAVGGSAILWLSPLWGRVRVGFYRLMGVILTVTGVLAFLSARGPLLDAPGTPATTRAGLILLASFVVGTFAWSFVSWLPGRPNVRLPAVVSLPVGVAALVLIGLDPGAARAPAIAVFQLLAGAVFVGAVTDGLLLGHWYLVDRRLSREPIRRMNQYFLAGCAIAAVSAALAAGGGAGVARSDFSPLLGVGALAAYLAIGLIALCATIGAFTRALIKEDSLQAATGLFYLGVIMGLSAEFAAKVRFF